MGLWPSEGSVSDEALALAAEAGFEWAASDNGVLARTIHQDGGAEVTYRSYLWQQNGRELRMIFRDHFLSDQVGFVYSGMRAEEAAGHFLDRIRENTRPMLERGADVLVPIILDGENAWEYYDHNGRPFLRELYRRISESIRPGGADGQRSSEAGSAARRSIISIPDRGSMRISTSGSAPKKTTSPGNICCERGGNSMKSRPAFPKTRRRLAYEELLIAEGSDWCWWYGPEHISENRIEFDELYRQHLANVYHALGLAPPEELSHPILKSGVPNSEPAAHASHPSGDRRRSDFVFRMDGRGPLPARQPFGRDAQRASRRSATFTTAPTATISICGWISTTGSSSIRSNCAADDRCRCCNNPAVQFARRTHRRNRACRSVFWGCRTQLRSRSTWADRELADWWIWPDTGSSYLRLEYLSSTASNLAAAGGGGVSPITICLLVSAEAYSSLFQSSSGRSVAPCSDMPANSAARARLSQDLGVQLRVCFSG